MNRVIHQPKGRMLLLSFCLLLAGLSKTSAQLPYSQSFKTNSAPGLVFGGSPAAFLTAGQTVSYGNGGTVTDPTTDVYLRLTANASLSGGYVYSNTPFPAQNGLKISFEYYIYAGSTPPADGLSFFLFDGSTTNFSPGMFGYGLGYIGMSNGYLGIGLDIFGNSSNYNGGPGSRPSAVTLRGPASTNYNYLNSHQTTSDGYSLNSGATVRVPDSTQAGYRRIIIQLAPKTVSGGYSYDISVSIVTGGATPVYHTVFNGYTGFTSVAPTNLKYGFAGSTGNYSEAHEIRNLSAAAYIVPAGTPTTNNDAATLSCSATTLDIPVLNNDVPANAPLAFDSTSVRFINPNNINDTGNSYSIAGVGTFSSSSAFGSQGHVTFTPEYLFAGTATIQYLVKDNYGVVSNASTITVNGTSRINTYAVSQTNVTGCYGGSNGAVTINGSTNPAGYTYAQGSGAYGSSGSFTGLTGGTYTFHTMNASGCVKDTVITITQPPVPAVTLTSSNICGSGGGSSTIIFTGTPNATVTYHVDNGADQTIILNGSGTATIPVSTTVNTTYTATSIVTPTPCTATLSGAGATTTVAVNPIPQGSITANGPFNSAGTGQLTFTATSGTGPFTVIYNDGTANRTATGVVSGTPFNTNPATVNATTTYTLVSVADANCTRTSGFTGSPATITVFPFNALAFDGINDYVQSGASVPTPQGNAARTIECWFKSAVTNSTESIVNWGTGTTNNRFGIIAIGGNMYIVGENNDYATGVSICDGSWHHLAVTFNGSTLLCYKDGALVSPAISKTYNTTGNAVRLGQRVDPVGTSEYLNGTLDEVRIWNRALCQAEIQNSMNGELPNPTNQNGLVLYYRFDQGSASGNNTGISTAIDASSSGSPGTLINFALTAGNNTSNFVAGIVVNTAPQFVAATPTVTTPGGATSFCAGSSLTLTTPAVNGYIYQWANNGNAISGATNNTYAAATAGSYTVTVTNTCGAVATSAATVITVNPNYTITAMAGSNGGISPSGASTICQGSNSTYTITPATGYHVLDVLIDGSSVGAITSYTFTSVNANHTLSATFALNCTAPVISCNNSSFSQSADPGLCTAVVTYNAATATGTSPAITYTQASGTAFNHGITTVTATATNGCGVSSCSFDVTVVDNQNPTVASLPSNIAVNNTPGTCGAAVSWTAPTAADNCSGATIAQIAGPAPGSTFAVGGPYTITYRATDAAGNQSAPQSFTVTVTDNEVPVLTLPSNATVNSQDPTTVAALGSATATDNCGIQGAVTSSDASTKGSNANNANYYNYTITRTWTANDIHGLSTSGNQIITVQDVTAPVVTAPAAFAQCSNTTGNNISRTATATDAASSPLTYSYAITGATTASGTGATATASFNVGTSTITWTVTDVSGNANTTATSTVTIYGLPVVSIASTTNPACNGQSNGAITTTTTGGTPTYSYLWTPGNIGTPNLSNVPAGMYSVTVTDLNGCTAAASATLTQPAVLSGAMTGTFAVPSCPAYNIYLGYGAQYDTLSAPASGGTAPYTYAWSGTGTSFQTTRRSVMPAATTTYTATITDNHGCIANASYQVKVLDVHCGPAYVGRERNNTVMMCRANAYACVSPTQAAVYINAGDCLGPCAGSARQANPANASQAFTGTISVYPNPAHSTVNVQLTGIGSSYKAYQVIDLTGRLVAERHLDEAQVQDVLTVDVSALVPGVYLIKITGIGGVTPIARFNVQ